MCSSVQKTRNGGTWTESRYWSAVRSALRRGFRYWKPLQDAKNAARRPVENKGRQKYEYQCASCQNWFKGNEVEVDHIIPCGKLNNENDLVIFLNNLTAENGYQVLCKPCHQVKTNYEKSILGEEDV